MFKTPLFILLSPALLVTKNTETLDASAAPDSNTSLQHHVGTRELVSDTILQLSGGVPHHGSSFCLLQKLENITIICIKLEMHTKYFYHLMHTAK